MNDDNNEPRCPGPLDDLSMNMLAERAGFEPAFARDDLFTHYALQDKTVRQYTNDSQ